MSGEVLFATLLLFPLASAPGPVVVARGEGVFAYDIGPAECDGPVLFTLFVEELPDAHRAQFRLEPMIRDCPGYWLFVMPLVPVFLYELEGTWATGFTARNADFHIGPYGDGSGISLRGSTGLFIWWSGEVSAIA